MAIKKIERTEINNILNIKSTKNTQNIVVEDEEQIFSCEEFYFTDIFDEKRYKSFIKNVEKLIRQSTYYNDYIGLLTNEVGLSNCAVLGNISKDMAKVEMHHFPFTLYDIVQIHICKNLTLKQKMTSFSIANDVMKDHYDNIVSLIPLCKTAHQLVHKGGISISINQTFGDIEAFLNKYKEYISDDLAIKYNKLIELCEDSDKLYASNFLLDSSYVKIENDVQEIDF